MSYACKILADSVNDHGHRLTTFEITFPRFILAEVNTHRMLSRNSASSRAIPVEKSIQAVKEDPFIPEIFGKNQPGMRWKDQLYDDEARDALLIWKLAKRQALHTALDLNELGVHKALANRVLEPFKWHTAIVTGTDWSNFFALRTDENAQPEFRTIALMMEEAYGEHEPRHLSATEWHLPLVSDEEINIEALQWPQPFIDWPMWKKVSTGRCARVSYLTHEGKRDLEADVALHDRLMTNGHLSPFEHVARPFSSREWKTVHDIQDQVMRHYRVENGQLVERLLRNLDYCGNFCGFYQYRFDIPNQDDFSKVSV